MIRGLKTNLIKQLKKNLHKAPGLNGVSPNVIKVLDNENRNVLFQICSDFFR